MATASAFAEQLDSTLTGPPPIVHRLLGKARIGVMMGEASELFGRAGGGGRLEARRVARGALPWTTGTSSSPSQAGTLLRRHMAGFYSAVDTVIKPDTVGTDWSFRFYVIPAVASALFDWMQ